MPTGQPPPPRPTTAVDSDVIRILADIKFELAKVREEGNARGIILNSAVEEIADRVNQFDERIGGLEEMIRRVAANRTALLREFRLLRDRLVLVENTQKSVHQRLDKLEDGQVENVREMSDHDLKHQADIAAAITHVSQLERMMKMSIQFKKDPMVVIPAILLIFGVGFLFWCGKITWEVGAGFIATGGLMPALFGRKHKKVDEDK